MTATASATSRTARCWAARRARIRHLTAEHLPAVAPTARSSASTKQWRANGPRTRAPDAPRRRRPAALARQLQPATATQLNRRPATDQPRSQRPWVGQLAIRRRGRRGRRGRRVLRVPDARRETRSTASPTELRHGLPEFLRVIGEPLCDVVGHLTDERTVNPETSGVRASCAPVDPPAERFSAVFGGIDHRRRFGSQGAPKHRIAAGCWLNGAALESNQASVGLPRLTGFEDRLGHRPHAAPNRAI